MSESQLATAPINPGFHKATSTLSEFLGIEPRMMIDAIKKQCFPGQNSDNISDAQLAAFVSVANNLRLNPLIPGHLYAYPSKNGGIVPVTGPDGVMKMLDEHISEGKLAGYECVVFPEDVTQKPTHAMATIWRQNNEHPSKYTAIFSEWVVGSNPNWASRPRHMIWMRAIKQCARQVIHGVPYDEDDVTIGDMKNVTPAEEQSPPPKQERPDPKPRRGAAAAKEAAKAAEVVVEQETKTEPAPAATEPKNVTPVTEPAKVVEPIKDEPKGPDEKGAPRAFLKDDEHVTVNCEVVSIECVMSKEKIPSVRVMVKGDYNNWVQHLGGGKLVGDKVEAADPWKVGANVVIKLHGKKSTATTGKSVGTILAWVEAVEAAKETEEF